MTSTRNKRPRTLTIRSEVHPGEWAAKRWQLVEFKIKVPKIRTKGGNQTTKILTINEGCLEAIKGRTRAMEEFVIHLIKRTTTYKMIHITTEIITRRKTIEEARNPTLTRMPLYRIKCKLSSNPHRPQLQCLETAACSTGIVKTAATSCLRMKQLIAL